MLEAGLVSVSRRVPLQHTCAAGFRLSKAGSGIQVRHMQAQLHHYASSSSTVWETADTFAMQSTVPDVSAWGGVLLAYVSSALWPLRGASLNFSIH